MSLRSSRLKRRLRKMGSDFFKQIPANLTKKSACVTIFADLFLDYRGPKSVDISLHTILGEPRDRRNNNSKRIGEVKKEFRGNARKSTG